MAAGLLSASNLSAQEHNGRAGGLFGGPSSSISHGLMNRSYATISGNFEGESFGNGATEGGLTGETFGAPVGNGLLVLLAAGAGYATMKSRKKQNKQNRKEK